MIHQPAIRILLSASAIGAIALFVALYFLTTAEYELQRELHANELIQSLTKSIRELKSTTPDARLNAQERDSFLSQILELAKRNEIAEQIEDVRMGSPEPIPKSSFAREETVVQWKQISLPKLLAFLADVEAAIPHCICSVLDLGTAKPGQSDDDALWRAKVTLTQTTRIGTSSTVR